MTFPGGSASYVYDDANRVTRKTSLLGGKSYSTDFGYDANDNITNIRYPSSLMVTYGYNGNNQVTAVTGFGGSVTSVIYSTSGTNAGLPTSYKLSNGITSSFGHNARNLITSVAAGNAMNVNYGYDSRGNTTSYTNLLDASKNQTYGYDRLNRLTSFYGSWGRGSYSYDATGNRLTKEVGTNSTRYGYTNNRLTSASGGEAASYTYRGDGVLTGGTWEGAVQSLGYDGVGNLASFSTGNKLMANYAYDGDGQRVMKTASGSTTVYHYDLAGQVISENDGNGIGLADYVYLNGKLIAKVSPSTTATAPPSIAITAASENFGAVDVGWATSRTFLVKNAGKGALAIGAVRIAGTSSGDFTVTRDRCSQQTVAANGACEIQVAFTPTSATAKTAQLTIPSNDPATPVLTAALNGIGRNPQLYLLKTGSGSGIVTSSDATIACGTTCSGTYPPGTVLTLTAKPSVGSVFTGWSGGGCSGTGTCTVSADSGTVTARFDLAPCANPPVRIRGKASYNTLQAAYDAAVDGDTIEAQAQTFTESLTAYRNVSVAIEGGYKCDFSSNLEKTVLTGAPVIRNGRVALRNVFIRN